MKFTEREFLDIVHCLADQRDLFRKELKTTNTMKNVAVLQGKVERVNAILHRFRTERDHDKETE